MVLQIMYRPVPGAAGAQVTLGGQGAQPQGVDHPVAAEGTNFGEGEVKPRLTEPQHIFLLGELGQTVSNDTDDAAACFQSSLLGGLIRAFCISGDQPPP